MRSSRIICAPSKSVDRSKLKRIAHRRQADAAGGADGAVTGILRTFGRGRARTRLGDYRFQTADRGPSPRAGTSIGQLNGYLDAGIPLRHIFDVIVVEHFGDYVHLLMATLARAIGLELGDDIRFLLAA